MRKLSRYLLIACGVLSLGLGVLGLFLPVMPTTPFLLVAAACFVRSSERMHRWLMEHPVFGAHLRDFRSGLGVPVRTKVIALSMVWTSIPASAALLYFRFGPVPVWFAIAAFLLSCALFSTWYFLYRLPTRSSISMLEAADTAEEF